MLPLYICWIVLLALNLSKTVTRDSGNDFDWFSFPFLESWILDTWAACNYPTRNANFKSRFSDIRLKMVSFLVSHYISDCHTTKEEMHNNCVLWKVKVKDKTCFVKDFIKVTEPLRPFLRTNKEDSKYFLRCEKVCKIFLLKEESFFSREILASLFALFVFVCATA